MENELLRRALDLARRAEKYAVPTASGFLTPAEQQELRGLAAREHIAPVFHGGAADCERCCAFFLPSWQEEADLDPSEAIAALRITAAFGSPGHRDYLGAILGLGIRRDCLGDIRIKDDTAHVLCSASIADYLADNLEKVGKCGVKTARISLSEVPPLERKYRKVTFTVQSLRLDSVCGGMFGLSRSSAHAQIMQGNVTVNYLPCLKPDQQLSPGDVISLRGRGKGTLLEPGGTSRKGRQFTQAEIWE